MELLHLRVAFHERASCPDRYVPECIPVRGWRRATMVLAILFSVSLASNAEGASVEARVKSAYLYNLLRRTSWPEKTFPNDESPYRVAVLGKDNLEGLLETIADKKRVNKRSIVLVRIESIDDYEPCHMLYVPGYYTLEQQKAVIAKTSKYPCLVVGDSPGYAAAGATANFVLRDDGTIGIELNLAEAKKHDLRFDEQLLAVAHVLGQ
ncbi:MAG: YfiR family protein [Pirellulaceae bacterium]|nr:YfiR family protein [Pirellulaceae bacterium]